MAPTRVCRTVSAFDIWATFITSLVALSVLLYFVVAATLCYIQKDATHQLGLVIMAMSCLVVAQIACIYWIRIRNNSPREIELLERFLKKGRIVIGDVHYPGDASTECCSWKSNTGTVIYRHPMKQYTGCFVRKQVTLVDKCSRELETLLILPGEPYSAQPKTDIQGLLAIARARYQIISVLGIYSLVFFLFCLLSAGYILFVMTSLDTTQDQPMWERYLGWIIYAASVIIIPCVALLLSILKWNNHLEWVKRGDSRFVHDDDDDYTTYTHLPSGVRDSAPESDV